MEDQSQVVGGTTLLMIKTLIKTGTVLCGDSNDTIRGKELNGQFATNLKNISRVVMMYNTSVLK